MLLVEVWIETFQFKYSKPFAFARLITHLKGWSAVDIRRAQLRDSLVAWANGRILMRLWEAANASTAKSQIKTINKLFSTWKEMYR